MADHNRRLLIVILFIITCQTIFTVYWLFIDKMSLERLNIDDEEAKISTSDNKLQVGCNVM